MDLGIFDHLDRRDMPVADFYEHRLRLLEKYDAAGVYSYHLAEHHATPLGLAPMPGIFLAAATQRTRRIRLGPCVYCLPLYNPLWQIEEVCMLDHLSRGRFDFGVGRGIVPYEMAFFDLHHLETEDIYRETLEIVPRYLITGRRVCGSSFGGVKGRDQVPELVDRYLRGEIDVAPLVSHKLTLDEVNRGFDLMQAQDGIRSVIAFG